MPLEPLEPIRDKVQGFNDFMFEAIIESPMFNSDKFKTIREGIESMDNTFNAIYNLIELEIINKK